MTTITELNTELNTALNEKILIQKQLIEQLNFVIDEQKLLGDVMKTNKQLLYACAFMALIITARALFDLLA